jgi:hypothetical protein
MERIAGCRRSLVEVVAQEITVSTGDPHSPHRYGDHGTALLRGLAFSHVGWLFISDASSAAR